MGAAPCTCLYTAVCLMTERVDDYIDIECRHYFPFLAHIASSFVSLPIANAAADERVDDDIEIEGGPQLAPNAKCPITAKPVRF